MPAGNIRDVRRRVRSVGNIQQITRAMKFVAASKLRRAQERIFNARPYANRMMAVLNSLATRAEPSHHPLLQDRDGDRTLLILITADRGLCGAFNSNIIRAASRFLREEGREESTDLTLVGRKALDWFRRRSDSVRREYPNIMTRVDFKYAQEIARSAVDYYTSDGGSRVYLAYNEFKSVIQQGITVEPLLPIQRLEPEGQETPTDYIYEQPAPILFDHLLSRHVETQVFRALLESEAAEHGARMTAMEAATKNASEMIEKLTLYMNRLRQSSITTEIIEVVSGSEALGA